MFVDAPFFVSSLPMKRRTFYLSLGACALSATSCRRMDWPTVHALWISRFAYQSPDDLVRIMRHAVEMGFTDIFFQVRAKGTVYYPSQHEPWAYELTSTNPADTGVDPGWNPLQTALDAAHRQGLRLHAYVNVLPGWHGYADPPAESGQHWVHHPDWFMVDRMGLRMDSTRWYSFLNPAHPAVRRHLRRLFRELAAFPVDGIHLDYIRYPDDFHEVAPALFPQADSAELKAHCDFSYDPFSLDQFGADPVDQPQAWNRFRRSMVTRLVGELSDAVRQVAPRLKLSASVIARPDQRPETFQEGHRWGRKRWVDWVVPMMYSTRNFEDTLRWNIAKLGRRRCAEQLVVGVYAKHPTATLVAQVKAAKKCRVRGVAVFSYEALVQGNKKTAKGEALRRCLLAE